MSDNTNLPHSINKLIVDKKSSRSELLPYHLVYESTTTRIFCNGELGAKVTIDPNLSRDQAVRALRLEQKVSDCLPSSCSQRKSLRVDTYQDLPALYFDWVDGVTVGEWLRSNAEMKQPYGESEARANSSLTTRLQLALAITKAVCDFHEAGVFHGSLNLENIILDIKGGAKNFHATLIDYSGAVILSDCSFGIRNEQDRNAFIKATKKKDLNDLGVVLYAVLGNRIQSTQQSSSDEHNDNLEQDAEVQRSKRGKRQQIQPSNNLPLYLISLIASLLTPNVNQGGDDQVLYKNTRDVLTDLQLAVSKSHIYLKAYSSTDLVSRPLIFPQGTFYGRRTELLMLQHSFDAMMEGKNKPCAFVVSGYAGAG